MIHSSFNPTTMPADQLEGVFVQRHDLANRLIKSVADGASGQAKRHTLLVGPRGMGKSHLVSLVYHRLKRDEELVKGLCIAYLREDEWGITSLLDLLVRILQATQEDENARDKSKAIEELYGLSTEAAEQRAWVLLKTRTATQSLVLVLENLDMILRNIGCAGQQRWISLIERNPNWIILATAPALFPDITDKAFPFFGFFDIVPLEGLTISGAVSLLRKLAVAHNDEKTAEFIQSPVGRARVRAVQHLAGGNYRIFVIFYEFLRRDKPEDLLLPLLKTIDALTPYYQAQMSRLSPQQQKLVAFLCQHGYPATVTSIAKASFITHQTAASQLKQLLTERYVRVHRVGRESYYELAEPLLRICIEAKSLGDRPLRLLVEFLRYWFSREELEEKLSSVGDRPERVYWAAAIREYDVGTCHIHLNEEIEALCHALARTQTGSEAGRSHAEQLAELSKRAEDWHHFTVAMQRLGKDSEIVSNLQPKLAQQPDDVVVLDCLARAYARLGETDRALDMLEQALKVKSDRDDLWAHRGWIYVNSGKPIEALAAFERASALAPKNGWYKLSQAQVLIELEEFKRARAVLKPLLPLGEERPGIYAVYGTALAADQRYVDGLKYFQKACDAFPDDAFAWSNRGFTLLRMGHKEESLQALAKSLQIKPDSERTLQHYCEALFALQRYHNAEENVPRDILSHRLFHELLDLFSSNPSGTALHAGLSLWYERVNTSKWRTAYRGALAQLVRHLNEFAEAQDLSSLRSWLVVLRELFSQKRSFKILLKLFEVMTTMKESPDRRAILAMLELPLEQRRLIVSEQKEQSLALQAERA